MRSSLPAGAQMLFSESQVQVAYDGLAARLNETLPAGALLMLPVMTGALFPAVELARRIDRPLQLDYVHASRYRGETRGGDIRWLRWPEIGTVGCNILLVDDIFDEGYTLQAIRDRLVPDHFVASAVLALKNHARGLPRSRVDYYGLEVPDRYVFGCGMDYRERLRELPEIWALPAEPAHASMETVGN